MARTSINLVNARLVLYGCTIEACDGGGGVVVVGVPPPVVAGVEALEEGAEREDLGEGDAAAAAPAPAPAADGVVAGVAVGSGEEEEEAVLEAVRADADDHLPGMEAAAGDVALPMPVPVRLLLLLLVHAWQGLASDVDGAHWLNRVD